MSFESASMNHEKPGLKCHRFRDMLCLRALLVWLVLFPKVVMSKLNNWTDHQDGPNGGTPKCTAAWFCSTWCYQKSLATPGYVKGRFWTCMLLKLDFMLS